MMLKPLQYFGHLMQRVDSLEMTVMLGETGGRRRRGQQSKKATNMLVIIRRTIEKTPP